MTALTPKQRWYLDRMGIQVWCERNSQDSGNDAAAPIAAPGEPLAADEDWQKLADEVAVCTRCELHRSRTQTVFGTGDPRAAWMLIGEAPGAEEDRRGEPFVGRAGQLLNAMLEAAGFQRQQVYIANILKCRPPNNRDPAAAEAAACESYLERQIALVRPSIILVLGRIAAQNLLKVDSPLGRMRGRSWSYQGIPVVVTYHPAYLLRNPIDKRKSWQDLQLALSITRGGA